MKKLPNIISYKEFVEKCKSDPAPPRQERTPAQSLDAIRSTPEFSPVHDHNAYCCCYGGHPIGGFGCPYDPYD